MTCHGEQSLQTRDSAVKRRFSDPLSGKSHVGEHAPGRRERSPRAKSWSATALWLIVGLLLVSCGPYAAPEEPVGEVVAEDVPSLPVDDDWEPPEPGSGRLRTTTTPDRSAASDLVESAEFTDEFLLHLPTAPKLRTVVAADSEIGLLGSRYAGTAVTDQRDSRAYVVVEEFLQSLRRGEFASDLVDDVRESSVRRRIQPVIEGDVVFSHFRIGTPDHSNEGTTVRVRIFSGDEPATAVSSITGELYLDDNGSIEDVQIDVLALEE